MDDFRKKRSYVQRKVLESPAYCVFKAKFEAVKVGEVFKTKDLRAEFGLAGNELGFILTVMKSSNLACNYKRSEWTTL